MRPTLGRTVVRIGDRRESNARSHDSGVRSLFTNRPDLTSDQYMYRQTLKQRAVALEHLVCGM